MKKLPAITFELEELKKLYGASTKVVGWYAHGPGDQIELEKATVRGPFHRWLIVEGGEGYEEHVATVYDDAKYAAAAMCMLPHLIAEIERLKAIIDNGLGPEDTVNDFEPMK